MTMQRLAIGFFDVDRVPHYIVFREDSGVTHRVLLQIRGRLIECFNCGSTSHFTSRCQNRAETRQRRDDRLRERADPNWADVARGGRGDIGGEESESDRVGSETVDDTKQKEQAKETPTERERTTKEIGRQ